MTNTILRWISYGLSILSLAACAVLLVADTAQWTHPGRLTAAVSAAPLLLVGVSFLMVQVVIRPRWSELLKNILLAATFLLWGAIQFMPQNTLSIRLGNLVIALYVLDLAWVTLGVVRSSRNN